MSGDTTEPDTGIRWYATMTNPRNEFLAAKNLHRQDLITFLPFEWVQKKRKLPNRNGFKLEWVREAFFPGYLFVGLDKPNHSVYQINETDGVSTVVYQGAEPLPIPHKVMMDLMCRADETGLVARRQIEQRKAFEAGQRVKFVDESPFAPLFAVVSIDKDTRVEVLLEILGKTRPVSVSPDLLRAV